MIRLTIKLFLAFLLAHFLLSGTVIAGSKQAQSTQQSKEGEARKENIMVCDSSCLRR